MQSIKTKDSLCIKAVLSARVGALLKQLLYRLSDGRISGNVHKSYLPMCQRKRRSANSTPMPKRCVLGSEKPALSSPHQGSARRETLFLSEKEFHKVRVQRATSRKTNFHFFKLRNFHFPIGFEYFQRFIEEKWCIFLTIRDSRWSISIFAS